MLEQQPQSCKRNLTTVGLRVQAVENKSKHFKMPASETRVYEAAGCGAGDT